MEQKSLRKVYIWPLGYLRPYIWRVVGIVACGMLGALGEMVFPMVFQHFVDVLLPSGNIRAFGWISGGIVILLPLLTIPAYLSYYVIGPYFSRKAAEYSRDVNERRAGI
jgi:ABC-type multidrug transport system fused ATPase/permease subunit